MAIRCKLISPTNLLLEHPMLSPVKEEEYVVLGVKEWKEQRFNERLLGAISGAAIVAMMAMLIIDLFFAATRSHAQKMPHGRLPILDYSLLIHISDKKGFICERGYGQGSTADIPWRLGDGRTWAECWDGLQIAFPPDHQYDYMKESVLRDFMQGPTFVSGDSKKYEKINVHLELDVDPCVLSPSTCGGSNPSR